MSVPNSQPPQVSVIIPCYNGASFLARAVDSVLEQSFRLFELLIVDDGSTDSSASTAQTYAGRDDRVRLLRHDQNRGLPAARNTGIQHSRAALLAFLDADDRWLAGKLAAQVGEFQDTAVGISCTAARYIYVNHTAESAPFSADPQTLPARLLFRNVIPGSASSVMLRRTCLETSGLFDETLVASEDRDLWFRLSLNYPFHFIDRVLVEINRQHNTSMSKDFERMAQGFAGFLHKREKDIPAELRFLLPRAWRYAHLRVALAYYQSAQYPPARTYAGRALRSSIYPDSDLRRSLLIWLLACLPAGLQARLAAPLQRRLLRQSEL